MAQISETLQNVKVVKSYCMEKYESRSLGKTFESMFDLTMQRTRIASAVSPVMEGLSGFILAGIILFGGWQISQGQLTTGSFVTFLGSWVAVYKPLKSLVGFRVQLQMAFVAASNVYRLIDMKPEIADAKDPLPMPAVRKGIKFKDVSFEYEPGKPVLSGINISVPAGKTVALVGHSGGGKSTIANLVPRFFDVTSGAITIDGVDIRSIAQTSLREGIALVSQEVMLFDASVRDNIAYGKGDKEAKDISDEEIIRAAKLANADKFILAMADGYKTKIGEHGVKLSGGQKQRVSIARALIKDAPILLLDEATSALDTESEHEVQKALDNLMKNRTTIVIAHRLSTIVGADKICVIDGGRVVEEGSHEELLARKGEYAKLYKMQFKEGE
jgi:subfamily B ATP-binding cassette protein MsbA